MPRAFSLRYLPEGPCASLPCLAYDREHVGRVSVRFRLHGIRAGTLAGLVEHCVAQGNPARLRSRKGLTSTRGDERATL
jgi:hypothetical protein